MRGQAQSQPAGAAKALEADKGSRCGAGHRQARPPLPRYSRPARIVAEQIGAELHRRSCHGMFGQGSARGNCNMRTLPGSRDARTGRVSGFQSETQRENFMAARARFSNGPDRQMPRCSALNRLGEPCKAARMRGQSTCFRHSGVLRPNARGWRPRIFPATSTASSAPRCEQNATGCAFSGGAIRASPAGRSCWHRPMRRRVEHGQHGREFSLMYSTVICLRSQTHAAGPGRGCRAV